MKVVVESPDSEGKVAYENLISTVLSEATIKGSISEVKLLAEPQEPLFVLSITLSKGERVVRFSDVVVLRGARDGVIAVCDDDRFLPAILRMLWDKFGDGVEQLSRNEILIKGELEESIMDSIVYDPEKELMSGLSDIITRIIPEGMRIRRFIKKGDTTIVISSEDYLKAEWIERALKFAERGV